jgi:hypothetical protein
LLAFRAKLYGVDGFLLLDKRSLGLMRIGLGLIMAVDILARALHFRAHYSWAGIMPLKAILEYDELSHRRWSVFFQTDSEVLVALLLFIGLLSSLSLAAGYRTRLAGWVCWITAVSLFRRNPLLCDAGDTYLAVLILWGNFLPWGEAYAYKKPQVRELSHASIPGFCYITQVALLYWFSAALRVGTEWQVDGDALYFALHIDPLTTGLAPWLLCIGQQALVVITFLTLLMEIWGPILLYLPFATTRCLSVFMIIAFHFGIFTTLALPVFATICMIAPLGLLPSLFWQSRMGRNLDRVLSRFARTSAPLEMPAPEPTKSSILGRVYYALPLFFLVIVIVQLRAGLHSMRPQTPLSGPARVFNLDQRWGMFSPHPTLVIGWESVQARTESGRVMNLMTGQSYSEEPQTFPNRTALPDLRWRYYQLALTYDRKQPLQYLLAYLVKQWDSANPDDPIVAAQYLYHPRATADRYILGEEGIEVMTVYHRRVGR